MQSEAGKLPRNGDKENSEFFEEALEKIYLRREQSGAAQLLDTMVAVMIQVKHGDLVPYLAELYLMGAYRLKDVYQNESHRVAVLTVNPEQPDLIVMEPLAEDYFDRFSALNMIYPRGRENLQARYLGEIYRTEDKKQTRSILKSQYIRFMKRSETMNAFLRNKNFAFTEPSYFSGNIAGYTESEMIDYSDLEIGEKVELSADEIAMLAKADEVQEKVGIKGLVYGIDHLATRVLCGEREHAILEFMTLTNYYFWGAYNIHEMNSSTNVNRNPKIESELHSPAKVFTANNTPYITKSIDELPSPTEDFVRNFGKRMHHMAYMVPDGATDEGLKNIDFVVGELAKKEVPFLAKIVGECTDFPDLKQIFSETSKKSVLITEYVQRCHGFQGFFTKQNVASLTEAAGMAEALQDEVEEEDSASVPEVCD